MRYVSIDIETTGLDPEHDQILEFGAVIDDTHRPDVPVEELPTFRRILRHERLTGTPFALCMNHKLIDEITRNEMLGEPRKDCIHPNHLAVEFARFLMGNGFSERKGHLVEFVVAGKNFGTFDQRFLGKLTNWDKKLRPLRRMLDPAILYFDPLADEAPPSLAQCLERAGLDPDVRHTAVDDARDVVRVLRTFWSRGGESPPTV